MTDTFEPSVENSSSSQAMHSKDERQTRQQSPRKDVFRKDVIFENVCCFSSPLSTSKSAGLQCSRRKASTGSLGLDEDSSNKPSGTSENQKTTCGKRVCCRDENFSGNEETNSKDSEPKQFLGLRRMSSQSSCESQGEVTTKLLTRGEKLPTDIDNPLNARAAVSTTEFQVDSDIQRIKRGTEIAAADANCSRGTIESVQENDRLRRVERHNPRTSPPTSKQSPHQTRALLVTDLDAIEDDLQAPAAIASVEKPSRNAPSGQQQQVSALVDVLWEFNGRKLSNFCQDLMTECGQLDGRTEQTGQPGIVTLTYETCIDDLYSCGYSTEWPNGERGSDAAGGGPPPSICGTAYDAGSSFDQGRYNKDDSHLMLVKATDENEFADFALGNDSFSDAFNADDNRCPLEYSSDSPNRRSGEISKRQGNRLNATQSKVKADSAACSSASMDGGQELRAITSDFDEKNPPGHNSDAIKSCGRRGRTMERGKYEASLLKDFIKPDQKKFSIAPPSQDFSLDTELAIWEPSDFVPDRHKSAPPADLSMKLARSDDTLLLRSRQTSVSPQRQRISGCRWIKGSKSVELLSSRNMSPSGARIRRRALSKEWQILTLTTREETTTLMKPNATKEFPLESDRKENLPVSQCSHQSDVSELQPKTDNNAEDSASATGVRFASDASANLHIAQSSNFTRPDIPETTDALLSFNHNEDQQVSDDSMCYGGSDVWEVISEALSDAMKEVELAEKATPTGKTKHPRKNLTYNDETDMSDLRVRGPVFSSDISSGISPGISSGISQEIKNEDDSEMMCERCDNGSSPSMEMDELVKALLDLARENDNERHYQQTVHADVDSIDSSKMTTDKFLDFSNNDVYPVSWHHATIPRNDRNSSGGHDTDGISENGTVNHLNQNALPHRRRKELIESNLDAGFEETIIDYITSAGNDDVAMDNDSILQITEETETPGTGGNPLSLDSDDPIERISTEQIDETDARQDDTSVPTDGAKCTRRIVSKQDDVTDVTSVRRRADSSAEVFPEKAFLESLFSSLGTIVFLLLAALIFHLFNRLVEHEL